MASSSSSSSSCASASARNERNGVDGMAAVAPPRAWPDAPPPPPPQPVGRAVYLQQLFRDPAHQDFVRREVSFLFRAVTWSLLIFIFIISFIILMWLIFHPIFPQLDVASAAMSTVTVDSTVATAECNITFQLTNPNHLLTTIYDRMEISLFYPSQQVILSVHYQPSFLQPKRTRTTIETNLSFTGVDLGSDVVRALKEDLDRGSLTLGIKILAIVKYRKGTWKTKSQLMRAHCHGVNFGFISSNKSGIFLNPYQECEVYILSRSKYMA